MKIKILFLFFLSINLIYSKDLLTFIKESDSLKEAFAGKFKIGTALGPVELNAAKNHLIKHFNSVTPANELKPEAIISQSASQQNGDNVNTQVTFGSGLRELFKFCIENKISLRGHTFCWHSQTPDWFFKENFQNNGNYVTKDIMG